MNKPLKSKKKSANDFLKYSGMAFQMAIYILIGVWAGKWLDQHFQTSRPYFTASLSVLFLIGYLYSLVKKLSK